jgi:hypothetical protein
MKAKCYTVLVCLLAMMPVGLIAQSVTGTIVGSVTDSSGAAITNAQVVATNMATSLSRAVQTSAEGEYRIEFLPVGGYSVEVTAPGFRKTLRKNIALQVSQVSRVDVSLEVGQTSESVEVTGAPPLVNTSNVELGRTVENKEINDLPIVNRNVYTLLDLTPGVQRNDNSIVLGYPEQRTLINGGVDGGAGSVNYYLDGGTNMTSLRNTGNILPNPDAIQEFRVQTNNYNAEYGRFANGVVNVLTKSGTNQFHGSAFEFVQNTILNANDWGNPFDTPPLHRNRFGGAIGGPIIKNKTFFFGSYAGLRQVTSTFLSSAIVPTALERTGDFSQSVTANGAKVFIKDPTKTGKCDQTSQVACFTSGGKVNVIPINRLDGVAMAIMNKFIPNANIGTNQWKGFIPSPYNTDEFLAKVDHNFNDNNRLTASYFESSGDNLVRAGTGNLPWSQQQFQWRQHGVNLSDTWVISPSQVNQAWVTFTRNYGGRLNLPQTSLSDLGSLFTGQGTPSLPQLSVNGFFNLTQAISGPVAGTNFYEIRDTFSYTRGKHSFKFGGEVSLDKDIQQALLNNYGVFTFNGVVTNNALADFETGLPSSLSQDAPSFGFTNTWYTALFVQDDYRVHPRLTLNLGVRWDVQTPPTDPQNKESTYVPGRQSTVNPTAPPGILFPGDPGIARSIIPVRWTHVSPRVGFAWDPFGDGKTAIRGGAGVFYGSLSGNQWNTTSNFEPFAIRLTFTNNNTATNKGAGATLSNPYRGLPGGDPFPYHGQFVNGGSIFGASPNFAWPYTYQLNFSVQREVVQNLSVMAAYVGSLSHNLPFAIDLNYPTFAGATSNNVQARRPNAAFGPVLSMQSNQTASYHALQLSATQRMSHHLMFNAFYIYSKTLSSVQLDNNTTQGGVQNFANIAEDRGRSDIDMRHQVVVSMIWQPDYYTGGNQVLRNVLNGWSISPILKVHSGFPFTVANGADANLDGNNNDRAQLIGDPFSGACPNGAPVGSTQCWINTAAFARNVPVNGNPVDGNSPRNFFNQPGYKDLDLAIFRTFKIRESVNLQVRGEAMNVFNMINLNAPNATVGTANFGTITSAQATRQLQLGLRATF